MPEEFPEEPHVKFFPYQIMLEVTALLIIAGILLAATSFPWEVRPQYDQANPPIHLEPEWYFMPVYMVLKTEGLGLPGGGDPGAPRAAEPRPDTSPPGHPGV